MLIQPRVQGFKKHPILHAEWQYVDVASRTGGDSERAGGRRVPD